MNAQQGFFNQLLNPAAAQYQAAQQGLPFGMGYDAQPQSKLAKAMNIAGYLGDFVGGVSQAQRGTPGILLGLGNVANRYNSQQFNAYQQQLAQQQKALEEQQHRENFEIAQRESAAQGLPMPATINGSMVTTPDNYRESLKYTGGVLGNQTQQQDVRTGVFAPQQGAIVSESYMTNRQNQQKSNLDTKQTLQRMPMMAQSGYGTVNAPDRLGIMNDSSANMSHASPVQPQQPIVSSQLNWKRYNPSVRKWSSQIEKIASEEGVDPGLVAAVMQQESGGNAKIRSSAGAIGLMQLMPGTAQGLGVDPNNPEQNLRGGVRYLKQQLSAFGGDVDKALAAYNAGPGAVQKYGGIPPYKETQAYVKRIKQMYGGGSGVSNVGQATVAPVPQGQVPVPAITPFSNLMGGLNAYNNSPTLEQQLFDNPFGTGIPNPQVLQGAFNGGAGLRQNDQGAIQNSTNALITQRGQDMSEQGAMTRALLNEQGASTRNTQNVEASLKNSQYTAYQAQQTAQMDQIKLAIAPLEAEHKAIATGLSNGKIKNKDERAEAGRRMLELRKQMDMVRTGSVVGGETTGGYASLWGG